MFPTLIRLYFRIRTFKGIAGIRFYPQMYKNIFVVLSIAWIFMYLFVLFNMWEDAIFYLNNINYYYRIYLAIVLFYFFNPFSNEQLLDEFHRGIVFSTALFLLASTTVTELVQRTVQITKKLKEDTKDLIERATPTAPSSHVASVSSYFR
jgi:hypothetical protein